MKINALQNTLGFPQTDSNITAYFKLFDTHKEYELASFNIEFIQPTDHKGEPQGEVMGGQITVAFSQALEEDFIDWAISYSKKRNGIIEFRVESASAPMKIEFVNGCCINFFQRMSSIEKMGIETTLVISSEEIIVNGISLYKDWI
jgi:hypothetical protein